MTGPHPEIFWQGPTPEVPRLAAAAYRDAAESLADELEYCDLLLRQWACRRALQQMQPGTDPGAPARAPDQAEHGERDAVTAARELLEVLTARVAARRVALDRRIEATRAGAGPEALPGLALAARLRLAPAELQSIYLLLAMELDPQRLLALVEAGGTPPSYLTLARLYELQGEGSPPEVWLARWTGQDSLLARRIVLRGDEGRMRAILGATPLCLAERVLAFLLGRAAPNPLLAGLVRHHAVAPPTGPLPDDLLALAGALTGSPGRGHALHLVGAEKEGGLDLVHRLAAATRYRQILEVEFSELLADRSVVGERLLQAICLEQQLADAVLLLRVATGLHDPNSGYIARHLRRIGELAAGPIITWSEQQGPEWTRALGGALPFTLPPVNSQRRHVLWSAGLARLGLPLAERELRHLADDYPLAPEEIGEVLLFLERGRGRGEAMGPDELRRACVRRLHNRLGRLADLVITPFRWSDLVLPDEVLERLHEIETYQRYRHQVLTQWNLASKLPYGVGIAALFSGPPGTGKTMAASVIANELGRELHRVDPARIVDKFIGETEKHLAAIFDAAAQSHAVLLFDEADGLFAKRTEVSSSNDRYANLETGFLLQRIEAHPGITILTTNHGENIDEAFLRRIPFNVDFPFPDAEARARIWRESIPAELPLAQAEQPPGRRRRARPPTTAIDFEALGESYQLSGGHIRSAVLRAAYQAAARGGPVTEQQLRQAAILECRGLGMLIQEAD